MRNKNINNSAQTSNGLNDFHEAASPVMHNIMIASSLADPLIEQAAIDPACRNEIFRNSVILKVCAQQLSELLNLTGSVNQ